ncbi:hypothetical protein [Treponema sp.]|uniref:hypothetical protein n=1 Tax=Treponema sp. TaxID=166 RepID=UPI00298E7E94|nr:hypothetical protein [Treponema sp.]MCQ2242528.1 hypothetical protein [Treponema sp.]
MDNTNPFEKPVSKDEFNGFWIPHHNAKVFKRGLEENKAPFLPDASGNIKAEPIYNVATGYCLPAGRLIPVQFAKMENGYSSNIVAPRTTIGALENGIKENEKGVFFNFKTEDGEIHVGSLFFPEQTTNPEGIHNAAKDKIQQMDNLKDVSMVIASSEPKEYLGTYIAACRSGMKLSVDPQIAEEFKGKIMPTLENDIRDPDKRDKNMPTLSNLLFDAEKRGADICRTLAAENGQSTAPKPQHKKSQDFEMCF